MEIDLDECIVIILLVLDPHSIKDNNTIYYILIKVLLKCIRVHELWLVQQGKVQSYSTVL